MMDDDISQLTIWILVLIVIVVVGLGLYTLTRNATDSGEQKLQTALDELEDKQAEEVAVVTSTPIPTKAPEKEVAEALEGTEAAADGGNAMTGLVTAMKPLFGALVLMMVMVLVSSFALKMVYAFMPAEMKSSEFGHTIARFVGAETVDAPIYAEAEKEYDYRGIMEKFEKKVSTGISSRKLQEVLREAISGDEEWQKLILSMQHHDNVTDWVAKDNDSTMKLGLMAIPCLTIGPSELTRKEIIATFNDAINKINKNEYSLETYNRYHSTFIEDYMLGRVWACNKEIVTEPELMKAHKDEMADLIEKYRDKESDSEESGQA